MIRIIGMVLLLLSGSAYGQLMKCVDKAGKVEYTNSGCPAGTKPVQTDIKSVPSGTAPAAAPEKSLAERDAEFRKRHVEKQESAAKDEKKVAEDQQRLRACNDARAYLKNLQAGNRLVKVDPNTGERSYLQDDGYASEMAAAQQSVDANCK